MIIQICVGSACHLKGSPDIIELLTQAIKENEHRRAFFIYSRQKLITQKNSLKPGPPPKPKSDKPKTIVDLPPPWTPQQRKKLSPTQVEEKLTEQKENVKWMKQFIMPQFTKRVFFHIDQREKLRQKSVECDIAPMSVIMLAPVVEKPDIISKQAST